MAKGDPNRSSPTGSATKGITKAVAGLMLTAALLSLAPREGEGGVAKHDLEFWRAISHGGFKLPPGESADALLLELSPYLGSPNPELRDGCAYETLAAWIYRDHRVQDQTLHRLLDEWRGNLRRGLGDSGSDTVFLRSFSALALSILGALDNEHPFMSPEDFSGLLATALAYLRGERDLRGYDPVKGWIHATAHTADLLKFLGRSPKLTSSQQGQILDGLAEKIRATGEAFTHGENERMAAAVQSLVLRADLDESAFRQFLSRMAEPSEHLGDEGPRVDVHRLANVVNGKDLLRSLYVGLAAREPGATCGEGRRGDLLRTVERMR